MPQTFNVFGLQGSIIVMSGPSIRHVCALFLPALLVVWSGCAGDDNAPATETGTDTKTAHLYQQQAGAAPVIRMGWQRPDVPDPHTIVGWLVYRGEFSGFPAQKPYLIEAIRGQNLRNYQDTTAGASEIDFNASFEYLDRGQITDGSVDLTYSRSGVAAGHTYYYRARRIVEPNSSAPPLAGSATAVFPNSASSFSVEPPEALSLPSSPQGPVTYLFAPVPSRPSDGASALDPDRITFRWTNSAAADEYRVRIHDTRSSTGQPVVESGPVYPSGTSGSWTLDTTTGPHLLEGNAKYYWVICARKTGEARPTCGDDEGWLKSAVMSFRTAPIPPPAP